jgi:hypothetical protein
VADAVKHKPRGSWIPWWLVGLDGLALGCLGTLLYMARLLDAQAALYAERNLASAYAVMDLADDLLIPTVVTALATVALALVNAGLLAWRRLRPLWLRLALVALCLLGLAALALAWSLRTATGRLLPPMTPTPTPTGWLLGLPLL